MEGLFEKMMDSLSTMTEERMMEECMRLNPRVMRSIPKRFRIIGASFIQNYGLKELNDMLEENGCETLYSRNYKEAGLMYAFLHKIGYRRWKELSANSNLYVDDVLERKVYQGKKLTYGSLRSFVKGVSAEGMEYMETQARTIQLNQELLSVKDEEAFYEFLQNNKEAFSKVREKARYYFCKYMYLYIKHYVEEFLKDRSQDHVAEILVINKKIRDKITKEDFYDRAISFNGIFNAFNYYFFTYVDSDWMDVLLDYYGDIKHLPEKDKAKLADSLRRYNKKWKDLSDQEVIRQQILKMEEDERKLDLLYASGKMDSQVRSRSGENMIRQIINGEIDIGRVALICYLLFFGSVLSKDHPMYLSLARLNTILRKCGFGELGNQDEFDRFVREYIRAEDQTDYLMHTVTKFAQEEKNFYLYHMQYNTYSNDFLFEKFLE